MRLRPQVTYKFFSQLPIITSITSTFATSADPGQMPGTTLPARERTPSPLRNRVGSKSARAIHKPVGTVGSTSGVEVNVGLQPIVARLKAELVRRGFRGIHSLGRRFRAADDDGSKSLNLAEFKKCLTETGLGLTDVEMRLLFSHFDIDGNGSVNFEEFLSRLRRAGGEFGAREKEKT